MRAKRITSESLRSPHRHRHGRDSGIPVGPVKRDEDDGRGSRRLCGGLCGHRGNAGRKNGRAWRASGHNGGRLQCLGRAFWAIAHISAELVELVPELNSTRDLQSIDVSDHGVRVSIWHRTGGHVPMDNSLVRWIVRDQGSMSGVRYPSWGSGQGFGQPFALFIGRVDPRTSPFGVI